MKYLILSLFGAGILVGSAYCLNRAKVSNGLSLPRGTAQDISDATVSEQARAEDILAHQQQSSQPVVLSANSQSASDVSRAVSNGTLSLAAVNQAVDDLVSPQTTYEQKRAAWKQLRDRGDLDQAIRELEQRTAHNPASAENAAVLGHAYIQKCSVISDVREQGILAMQADKLFDTALNLDPANWEARFTKAVSLSYWPASMGKTEEVIQQFTTLIQQQETQTPQAQFADSYIWLGDQYQKAGRNDDAKSVWERGVSLFPDSEKLRGKLTASR